MMYILYIDIYCVRARVYVCVCGCVVCVCDMWYVCTCLYYIYWSDMVWLYSCDGLPKEKWTKIVMWVPKSYCGPWHWPNVPAGHQPILQASPQLRTESWRITRSTPASPFILTPTIPAPTSSFPSQTQAINGKEPRTGGLRGNKNHRYWSTNRETMRNANIENTAMLSRFRSPLQPLQQSKLRSQGAVCLPCPSAQAKAAKSSPGFVAHRMVCCASCPHISQCCSLFNYQGIW